MPTDAVEDFDFRRMSIAEAIRWFAEHGEPVDPRTDIDPESLERRFPHLTGVRTFDETVESPHGPLPIRAYRHDRVAATGRGFVWVHGGGFFGGTLDMPESDWVARELTARGIPVVAVDYTKCLGDVHYPVPSDDVLAAWRHVRSASERLLGVGADDLVLGGASAGAALTAGAVARLRDAGEPLPAGLLLVYPVVHPNGPDASAEVDPESKHGQLALNFAGTPELYSDPHAFAGAGDGREYPPTLIIVCEQDDLRPSGERFAETLGAAGVDVTLHLEPDAHHGHINEPGEAGALRTIDVAAEWLARGADRASSVDRLRIANRSVVEAFFTSNLDHPEERLAVWHPDGVKELPFAPKGLTKSRWEGRDEIVANTMNNAGMFADCVHRDIVIHPAEDPELFFVTSRMVPGATFLGEPYPQSFIHLIRVRDGKVLFQQEYFDSEILASAERAARAEGRNPLT